ncbi:hypothetical protein HDV02_004997 [Globomyces sp. JEL0801]|nr:hypothetical protein HDV02_004997 [Globomyces sp. JEL0801]
MFYRQIGVNARRNIQSRWTYTKLLKSVPYSSKSDIPTTTNASPMSKISQTIAKAKEMAVFYFNGIKLLMQETTDAKLLKMKVKNEGYQLNRKEFVFIHRNGLDFRKMVPFFLISTFIPEMIPVLIMRGTTLIPSTCITEEQLNNKRIKLAETRESIALELFDEMNTKVLPFKPEDFKLDSSVRNIAQNHSEFFDLQKQSYSRLVQYAKHLNYLKEDDKYLNSKNTQSLTKEELISAIEDRGFPTAGGRNYSNKLQEFTDTLSIKNPSISDGLIVWTIICRVGLQKQNSIGKTPSPINDQ